MANLLTIVVMALILTAVFVLLKKAKYKFDLNSNHVMYYCDKGKPYILFKSVISVGIAIGLFIGCLCFYETIKKLFSYLNIFSIWLQFASVGLIIWNGRDLKNGFN